MKEVVDKPEGLEAGTVKNDSGTVEHKDEDTNQKTSSITIVLSASHVSNQERQTKPWADEGGWINRGRIIQT